MKKSTRKSATNDDNYCVVDRKLNTIYLSGDVTHKMASKFRRAVCALEDATNGKDIIVEINSPGGDIEAGLMMIDTMDLCKSVIITRATGQAASMGSMLLACGKRREALPSASIMVHQGTFSFRVRAEELDNETAECRRVEDLCWAMLDQRTHKDSGYWKKLCGGKNLYLTADQALRENLIDSICGKKEEQ